MSEPDESDEDVLDHPHPRAKQLVPDDFFWDCVDELAPFGSDEGATALDEFVQWRREHPKEPVVECVRWVIESVGEMGADQYGDSIADPAKVKGQVEDDEFDDQQFIYTLDASVIATGFGQLVLEGKIDVAVKPYVARALKRQQVWARTVSWEHADEYVRNLRRLEETLQRA